MKGIIKKFLLTASMVAGISAITSNAASAFTLFGSDYLLYESDGTNTFVNQSADLNSILIGNKINPGGNVELAASSEQVGFDFSQATSLIGEIGGKIITLSSLTATDWFGAGNTTTVYGADNFANRWFNSVLAAYNFDSLVSQIPMLNLLSPTSIKGTLFNSFLNSGGFQRASDPNISYVNHVGNEIAIGLAGHFNLDNQISSFFQANGLGAYTAFLPQNVQLSEVVKVNYNGESALLSSLSATESGQFELGDGISHNGNYEIKLAGAASTSVPEPASIFGLMVVGGIFATRRKQQTA
ncbi:MAG: PEP-CTERM sorting domain-containing protein [Symploca sp. SIO3C6]|nr:PEP-CTERM sorting domain-containing protein [Symploca sp. SIO3C6]NET08002.1 PEP-CTERM sorting domain-containing protein [Symploca sp. SIO2B6]NET52632.1 PEP-CTERM sorting domain-containing protein [Merismopedia sp. SIO2A8]